MAYLDHVVEDVHGGFARRAHARQDVQLLIHHTRRDVSEGQNVACGRIRRTCSLSAARAAASMAVAALPSAAADASPVSSWMPSHVVLSGVRSS